MWLERIILKMLSNQWDSFCLYCLQNSQDYKECTMNLLQCHTCRIWPPGESRGWTRWTGGWSRGRPGTRPGPAAAGWAARRSGAGSGTPWRWTWPGEIRSTNLRGTASEYLSIDIAMRTFPEMKYPKILRNTMTLQVSQSAHQDTVAVQAISRGIPIKITYKKRINDSLGVEFWMLYELTSLDTKP